MSRAPEFFVVFQQLCGHSYSMFNDMTYAARVLLQSKGWTLMAVLSLALGIGANTALLRGSTDCAVEKAAG